MSETTFNRAGARAFLEGFRPSGPWHLVSIFPDSPPTGISFTDIGKALTWAEGENKNGKNLYFHINPNRLKAGKAKKEDVTKIEFLFVDIDPKNGETKEELLSRLTDRTRPFWIDPCIILDSGGGYWGFWRIKGRMKPEDAEHHGKALEKAFGADSCHNVDRIARLPFTTNYPNKKKKSEGREISFSSVVRADYGMFYEPYWFESYTRTVEQRFKTEQQKPESKPKETTPKRQPLAIASIEGMTLPDELRRIILDGRGSKPKLNDDSRSAWAFDVAQRLAKLGVDEDTIAGILLNSEYKISAHCLDQADPARCARKHAQDAVKKIVEETAPKKTPRPPLTVWRRDDLVNLQNIDWIIKRVLPAQGVGIVYGASMVGKSFFMLDQAAAIARGSEWFGFIPKPRPVVYVALEGQHGFKTRVQAWEKHNECKFPEQVIFIPDQIDIRKKQDTDALIEVIQAEVDPGALVIIDTLNRAAPGMEENSSVDYGQILNSAARIQENIGGFVCFIAHPGKDPNKGIRGHSSLFAGLDMVLKVEVVDKDALLFSWETEKVKDGQDGQTFHFRREVVHLGNDEDGDPITSCIIEQEYVSTKKSKYTSADVEKFEVFKKAVELFGVPDRAGENMLIGVDREEWRNHFYEESSCTTPGSKKSAFNKLINKLKSLEFIKERTDGLLVFADENDHIESVPKEAGTLGKNETFNTLNVPIPYPVPGEAPF